MDNHETKMLRRELEALKRQVVDLTVAQNNDRAEAIKAILAVDNALTEICVVLWPVVHKNFPEFAKMQQQIDAIINRPRPTKS